MGCSRPSSWLGTGRGPGGPRRLHASTSRRPYRNPLRSAGRSSASTAVTAFTIASIFLFCGNEILGCGADRLRFQSSDMGGVGTLPHVPLACEFESRNLACLAQVIALPLRLTNVVSDRIDPCQ